MLRKKFGGPRASAAKQVVAIKAGVTSSEEPNTSPTLPHSNEIETSTASVSANQQGTPEKFSIQELTHAPSASTDVSLIRKRTESIKEVPEVNNQINDQSHEVFGNESIIFPGGSQHGHPRVRTFSQTSMFSTLSTSSMSANKRKKRLFEKDEDLDPTKFTMADLVDWRPRAENTLRTKWKELEKKFKEEGFAVKKEEKKEDDESEAVGPKVKIDDQGNVVIDEESLVVRRNPEDAAFETVDDDLIPKKLNSLSFRKNFSRTTLWSELETELFYEVLSSTGTDFSMMQEYLPFKTRADCKKKFNKEEKINMRRINETLRNPSILDDRIIKERVERYMGLINTENEKKVAEKSKKNKKKTTEDNNGDEVIIEDAPVQQKGEIIDVEVQEAPEPPKKAGKRPRREKANKELIYVDSPENFKTPKKISARAVRGKSK